MNLLRVGDVQNRISRGPIKKYAFDSVQLSVGSRATITSAPGDTCAYDGKYGASRRLRRLLARLGARLH